MEGYWKSILNLFAPPVCNVCGQVLPEGIDFMCAQCRWEMPVTDFHLEPDNKVAQKFWGLVPLEGACSFFVFRHGSNFRRAIHDLKYRGYWKTSVEFGYMFGQKLKNSPPYSTADIIIPVPLHTRKLLKRGYNQSEYIARGLAAAMNIPVSTTHLIRHTNNKAQVKSKFKYLRWGNVKDIFGVRNPHELEGKHILLVDDVLTTGATICSCAQRLVREIPDCRISVATLAVSEYEISKKQL